jgi:hypothetical protein
MQGHAARPTEISFAILHTSHGVMIITHAARAGGVGVAARRLVRRLQQWKYTAGTRTGALLHYSLISSNQTRPWKFAEDRVLQPAFGSLCGCTPCYDEA